MFWFFNRSKKKTPSDDGPVYTFKQKASTITISSLIVIDDIPCEVKHVEKTEGIDYLCKFTASDIFTGEKYYYQCKAFEDCDCPYVFDTNYLIQEISAQGLMTLRTLDGAPREPLSLLPPWPEPHTPGCERCDPDCDIDCVDDFLTQHIKRLKLGRTMLAAVKSAMGKEHVCGILMASYIS